MRRPAKAVTRPPFRICLGRTWRLMLTAGTKCGVAHKTTPSRPARPKSSSTEVAGPGPSGTPEAHALSDTAVSCPGHKPGPRSVASVTSMDWSVVSVAGAERTTDLRKQSGTMAQADAQFGLFVHEAAPTTDLDLERGLCQRSRGVDLVRGVSITPYVVARAEAVARSYCISGDVDWLTPACSATSGELPRVSRSRARLRDRRVGAAWCAARDHHSARQARLRSIACPRLSTFGPDA